IRVRYSPSKLGASEGKLILKTNDPDQPDFIFDLSGNAVAPPPEPEPDEPPAKNPPKNTGGSGAAEEGDPALSPTSSQDGGCGCRAAPSSPRGWALAPLLLGSLLLRRSSSSRFRRTARRQESLS
ncbi:MAG: MYXO-CTERM sorting domain-containing protein, partial [Polyangiaceae bacterium]|nr:MYXO-CTERM sorting domain-containing protein [Polyangiaceae bacterium]